VRVCVELALPIGVSFALTLFLNCYPKRWVCVSVRECFTWKLIKNAHLLPFPSLSRKDSTDWLMRKQPGEQPAGDY